MASLILLSVNSGKRSCDLAKNVYEVDQERGGENCLFLRSRGRGIDLQERKKLQITGGVPRGKAWLQVKLNHVSVDGWMVNFMKYWVASLQ